MRSWMRSWGALALALASRGGPGTLPEAISEAETRVFSLFVGSWWFPRRRLLHVHETPLKLMFRLHQSCRATHRNQEKIVPKAARKGFSAAKALVDGTVASPGRLRRSPGVPGALPGGSRGASGASRGAPGAPQRRFWVALGRFRRVPARPLIDP